MEKCLRISDTLWRVVLRMGVSSSAVFPYRMFQKSPSAPLGNRGSRGATAPCQAVEGRYCSVSPWASIGRVRLRTSFPPLRHSNDQQHRAKGCCDFIHSFTRSFIHHLQGSEQTEKNRPARPPLDLTAGWVRRTRSCPSMRQELERRGDPRPTRGSGRRRRGVGTPCPRRVSLDWIAKYKRI